MRRRVVLRYGPPRPKPERGATAGESALAFRDSAGEGLEGGQEVNLSLGKGEVHMQGALATEMGSVCLWRALPPSTTIASKSCPSERSRPCSVASEARNASRRRSTSTTGVSTFAWRPSSHPHESAHTIPGRPDSVSSAPAIQWRRATRIQLLHHIKSARTRLYAVDHIR